MVPTLFYQYLSLILIKPDTRSWNRSEENAVLQMFFLHRKY